MVTVGGQFLQEPLRHALIHRIVLDQEDAAAAEGRGRAGRGGGAQRRRSLSPREARDPRASRACRRGWASGPRASGLVRPGSATAAWSAPNEREQHEGQPRVARIGAQGREQVEAALHRHELIRQHAVEALARREPGERLIDARDGDGLEAEELELGRETLAADREVIDDEDLAGRRPAGSGRTARERRATGRVTQKREPRARPRSRRRPRRP